LTVHLLCAWPVSLVVPVLRLLCLLSFFFQAEDGIRDATVTGVQTCALPIWNEASRLREVGGVLRGDGLPLEDHRGGGPLSRVAEPRSFVPGPEPLRHGHGDLSLAAPTERPDGGRGSDSSPRAARRRGPPDPPPGQRPPPGPPSADSGPAGRRGAAAAQRLRRRRLDGSHHTRAARDLERRAPERSARTTGAALDSLRHLRGRQLGRDGTGRVRGDRGDGGGRPPDPGDRIEPRYLPVDHRVDRALDLWDARGEGGPRPPAVWRSREDHARCAAARRRYPSD